MSGRVGKSVLPQGPAAGPRPTPASLLLDQEPLASRTLFWRIRSETAVRKGKWKLVQIGNNRPELYDLEEDLGESQDLSDVRPDTVQALEQELSAWTEAVQAER